VPRTGASASGTWPHFQSYQGEFCGHAWLLVVLKIFSAPPSRVKLRCWLPVVVGWCFRGRLLSSRHTTQQRRQPMLTYCPPMKQYVHALQPERPEQEGGGNAKQKMEDAMMQVIEKRFREDDAAHADTQ